MKPTVKKIIAGFVILTAFAVCFPRNSISKTQEAPSDTIVLTSDNTLVLNSEVNGESASKIIMKAKEIDAALSNFKEKITGKKPVYLFIYSPGGSIQSGLEITEALRGLGRPVHTITLFAASMGFQLAQSFDDRLILRNGVLMSHHAAGEASGEFGGSVRSQMENRLQLWLDRMRELDEQTVKRTKGKQTYESYTKEYDHEMWLTGSKSVDEGYADKIVTVKCDATLKGVTTTHIDFLGMDIAYDLDNCPINTSPMNVRISPPAGEPAPNSAVINMVKEKFLTNFENKQKQVLPFRW